jgi:hypothetical protein
MRVGVLLEVDMIVVVVVDAVVVVDKVIQFVVKCSTF